VVVGLSRLSAALELCRNLQQTDTSIGTYSHGLYTWRHLGALIGTTWHLPALRDASRHGRTNAGANRQLPHSDWLHNSVTHDRINGASSAGCGSLVPWWGVCRSDGVPGCRPARSRLDAAHN